MAVFDDTLFTMTGRVRSFRPDISAVQAQDWLNDRIRQALDIRTYWSDLLKPGIISCPALYNTGTVSTATGSKVVTGVSTAWPVSDVVNTTIAADINEIRYVEVTPGSMAGITFDSLLYVSSVEGAEVVPVIEVKTGSFIGYFSMMHTTPITVTQSSLAGRQFRLGSGYPLFTITAVTSATGLLLELPWGGAAVANLPYSIIKAYYTIAPDIRDYLAVIDQQNGWPLRRHTAVNQINWMDPQRTSTGPPLYVVDLQPSQNGCMQYELYPNPTSQRQLSVMYYKQWPMLENDEDRPPWFINPTVFIHGAIADALRYKKGKGDEFYNPQLAQEYESKYMAGVEMAKNADESKAQRAFEWMWEQSVYRMGANWNQSHDADAFLLGW